MTDTEAPPRLRGSRLLRQAGTYTFSNLLSRALPFLLLPILTRFLTPTDYGLIAMFALASGFLEPFVGMSLAGAVTVKYFDPKIRLPMYLGTGAAVVAAAMVPTALVILALSRPLSAATQLPLEWLLLLVPVVAVRALSNAFLALLRVLERAATYALLQNLQTAGAVALTIVFVVGMGGDWRGRATADVTVTVALFVVALWWLVRNGWIRPQFDASYARNLLQFGVPLIPHVLGSMLIVQTDRLLLVNLVSLPDAGLYTVGYQLAIFVELIAASFNYAYAPWLLTRLGSADEAMKRRLVRLTYVQFAAMAVLAAAVAFFMPAIAGFALGSTFAASSQYIGWFALAFLFSGMYYMVTNYIFYAEQTRWLAASTISVALINIPLTYVFIKINGGVGAAQAMAVSMALTFLLTWWLSQRVFPMPWFGDRVRRQ